MSRYKERLQPRQALPVMLVAAEAAPTNAAAHCNYSGLHRTKQQTGFSESQIPIPGSSKLVAKDGVAAEIT